MGFTIASQQGPTTTDSKYKQPLPNGVSDRTAVALHQLSDDDPEQLIDLITPPVWVPLDSYEVEETEEDTTALTAFTH